MKKKVLLGFSILALLLLSIFVRRPFMSRPLEKLENPRLVVKKGERKLEIFDGEKLVKTYKIVLGFAPEGDKEQEGDGKTPLGEFYVFTKNDQSRFYLSLGLSYPSIDDAARGLRENLISPEEHDAIVRAVNEKKMPPQKTRLGGEIYIHGGGTEKDWTWGCMALKNEEMKELFERVPVGAKVTILP
jgi:murein L,D-transpeptidase YafK